MTSMSPMASMSPEERMQYNTDPPGAGWLFFAGTMLGLAGLMRVVDSIWAFRYNGALPAGLKDGVLGDNLTTYGWVWLVVGIVLIISSFMLLSGYTLTLRGNKPVVFAVQGDARVDGTITAAAAPLAACAVIIIVAVGLTVISTCAAPNTMTASRNTRSVP